MSGRARRRVVRRWQPMARRALLALCLWNAASQAALACRSTDVAESGQVPGTVVHWPDAAADPAARVTAWYADLTPRYGHAVLGDGLEPETLVVFSQAASASCGARVTLDENHVFEDTAPRLADLDGDGTPEIITVRSHVEKGAQLAIYALGPGGEDLTLRAATPYIGTRFRWLAPVGIADLDGDGTMEIAYVDRPHLARTLRLWRLEQGRLTEVAAAQGVTNHRIGETDIAGGIRRCGGTPEMILAGADWSDLLALRFDGATITARRIGGDTTRAGFARAMACRS